MRVQDGQVKWYFTDRQKNSMGTVRQRKTSSGRSGKKKKLSYQFKEISTAIMQTKNSESAGRVLLRARSRAALLRQKMYSGEYDKRELKAAILHADAMVRIARKRMRHLSEEEQAGREEEHGKATDDGRGERSDLTAVIEQEQEAQGETRELTEELSEELSEELTEELQEMMEEVMASMMEEALQDTVNAVVEMEPADLETLKRKHRSKELRELMEADMKYLKALFDRLEQEKRDGPGSLSGTAAGQEADPNAVSLELGGARVPLETIMPVDTAAGQSVDISI